MNKKDIIDTVVILLILINLVILAEIKGYKLDKKQVEINELQNKVDRAYRCSTAVMGGSYGK